MKTEPRARYSNFAIALLTGICLTGASVYLAGVIAAIPIPKLPQHIFRDHLGVVRATIELMGALPLTFTAWVVGRLLFRALGDSSRQLWIAVGLPWLACQGAAIAQYAYSSGYQTSRALSIILGPQFLAGWAISVLSVPAGLWLASRYTAAPSGPVSSGSA